MQITQAKQAGLMVLTQAALTTLEGVDDVFLFFSVQATAYLHDQASKVLLPHSLVDARSGCCICVTCQEEEVKGKKKNRRNNKRGSET